VILKYFSTTNLNQFKIVNSDKIIYPINLIKSDDVISFRNIANTRKEWFCWNI